MRHKVGEESCEAKERKRVFGERRQKVDGRQADQQINLCLYFNCPGPGHSCNVKMGLSPTSLLRLAYNPLSLFCFATFLANFVPRIHHVQCVSPFERFSDRVITRLAAVQ